MHLSFVLPPSLLVIIVFIIRVFASSSDAGQKLKGFLWDWSKLKGWRKELAKFSIFVFKGNEKKKGARYDRYWLFLLIRLFFWFGRTLSPSPRIHAFFLFLRFYFEYVVSSFDDGVMIINCYLVDGPSAGPRFGDATPSRVAVKRDDAASMHCRVNGDVPIHLAWRRSSSSTAVLTSNHRFVFFFPSSLHLAIDDGTHCHPFVCVLPSAPLCV